MIRETSLRQRLILRLLVVVLLAIDLGDLAPALTDTRDECGPQCCLSADADRHSLPLERQDIIDLDAESLDLEQLLPSRPCGCLLVDRSGHDVPPQTKLAPSSATAPLLRPPTFRA